jgi:DNA polymerase I-like protein with 3'-5' exonuclease and polymerase domains
VDGVSDARKILAAAAAAGVTLTFEDGELYAEGLDPPPELIEALRAIRPELRRLLVEPPRRLEVDGVEVVRCDTVAEAAAMVKEMGADAHPHPVALDIETTPILPERQRRDALVAAMTATHAETLAAKKAIRAGRKAAAHDDAHVLEDRIAALAKEEKRLAHEVDYARSAGLDPHRAHIRTVQLYGGGKRAAVIDVFRAGQSALALIEGLDAVIHNAAFEIAHLAGVNLGKIHDTQQAAKLTLGIHKSSLAAAVSHYLKVELDKETRDSDWGAAVLSEDQIRYAARDVIWLMRLCPPLFRDLAPQISAYRTQLAAVPAVARMNRAGITLDLARHAEALETFADQDAVACAAYQAACLAMDPPRPDLAAKVPRSDGEVAAFLKAVLSEEELKGWRQVRKPWELSTARSELRKAIQYPPVAPLIEIDELDSVRLTFGETLRHLVSPVTGRLHPSYQVCGAPPGRSSCAHPNLQGAPRNPKIRALIKAAAGHVFVAADYSCMELRGAAYFFDDTPLAAVFERGEDPHKITAARVAGKPVEAVSDDERTHAKATNFGTIYGISPAGLVEQIWKNAHKLVSAAEAEGLLAAFEQLYTDLMAHRREYVQVCQKRGAIVVGSEWRDGRGRIVPFARLPKDQPIRTCCLSYPIQGLCADVCMKAVAEVDRRLIEERLEARLVAWVHDELIVEASEREAEAVKTLLKDAMEQAFLDVFPKATLLKLVEVNVGPNWAAVKEKKKPVEGVEGG